MSVRLFAGASGFSYKAWKGPFYPEGLPDAEMLAYYAARLPAVEINNTFYRRPRPMETGPRRRMASAASGLAQDHSHPAPEGRAIWSRACSDRPALGPSSVRSCSSSAAPEEGPGSPPWTFPRLVPGIEDRARVPGNASRVRGFDVVRGLARA
jgi:hypothetical protein